MSKSGTVECNSFSSNPLKVKSFKSHTFLIELVTPMYALEFQVLLTTSSSWIIGISGRERFGKLTSCNGNNPRLGI